MSWHFLQGLEEASWEGSSLDGAPSALLNSIPIAVLYCWPDSATAFSLTSQFGTTSKRSTVGRGAAKSTSFPAGSHARTSAPQEAAQALRARKADSGWRWPGSFVRYDRGTSSWRTRQCSLLAGLDEFSEIWPNSGSMRDGECSAPLMLGLHTTDIACGLLPTPLAADASKGTRQRGTAIRGEQRLMLAMLPTPTTAGNENSRSMLKWAAHRRLKDLLGRMLPTPTAQLYGSNRGGAAGRVGKVRPSLDSMTGGPWISLREWMMGWPIGWTELRPLETDRFHVWLRWHGEL